MKYNKSKIRTKILKAGLELFLTQGYEETTITQILEKASSSRSAFYNHFKGKEDLLFSVAYLLDDAYSTWYQEHQAKIHAVDLLIQFQQFIMKTTETSPYRSLYPALYGLQVKTTGTRHILNSEREYNKILHEIIQNGQNKGEISSTYSSKTLRDMIISIQIGLTYSWCLDGESFSLTDRSNKVLIPFLSSLRTN